MKSTLTFLGALTALIVSSYGAIAQKSTPLTDTVYMGAGYKNEVYYSMEGHNKGTIDRKQWDIAIRASKRSASIITNDAANNSTLGLIGVELYTYPKTDTSGWSSVDTSGMSGWTKLVNSTTDWETGAFNVNQKGHPDYGWGVYNAVTHDLVGDSLYIIKLRDGSLKKLWIIRKYSAENVLAFRYSSLNGSGDTSIMFDCNPYVAKNFVGFSMTTGEPVDFEPAVATDWDILFTKYIYTYPDGVTYAVTGVLSNYDIKVNKFEHVGLDFTGFNQSAMDSTRSPIGWEWKYLDNNFIYHVTDSLVYFVQDKAGSIYKLVFKEFAGSSTGRIVFETQKISAQGITDPENINFNMAVYPNPAVSELSIVLNPGNSSRVTAFLTDVSGRTVLGKQLNVMTNELNTLKLPVDNLLPGLYMLHVNSGSQRISQKILIQH
jgi:hypothetical protein